MEKYIKYNEEIDAWVLTQAGVDVFAEMLRECGIDD